MIQIEIPYETYEVLSRWTSVSRTIDSAIDLLLDPDSEQAQFTISELNALRKPLDDCNQACKELKAEFELAEFRAETKGK